MRYSLLLILFFIAGCQHVDKPEKPNNLIPKDKMVNVLADVYISNAARNVNTKILYTNGVKLDSFIYRKYKIDSLQFARSNAFYSANLETYGTIIKKVEDRVFALKRKQDSLLPEKDLLDPNPENLKNKSPQLIEAAESEAKDSIK